MPAQLSRLLSIIPGTDHTDAPQNAQHIKMDATTWKSTIDYVSMLRHIDTYYHYETPKAIRRKERLFIHACCKRIWRQIEEFPLLKECILCSEKYADEGSGKKRLSRLLDKCTRDLERQPGISHVYALMHIANAICTPDNQPIATIHTCFSICIILGIDHESGDQYFADLTRCLFKNPSEAASHHVEFSARAKDMANYIYSNDCLDQMPILADLLEVEGCEDQDLLQHCRTGLHAKGCWALDSIMGI